MFSGGLVSYFGGQTLWTQSGRRISGHVLTVGKALMQLSSVIPTSIPPDGGETQHQRSPLK